MRKRNLFVWILLISFAMALSGCGETEAEVGLSAEQESIEAHLSTEREEDKNAGDNPIMSQADLANLPEADSLDGIVKNALEAAGIFDVTEIAYGNLVQDDAQTALDAYITADNEREFLAGLGYSVSQQEWKVNYVKGTASGRLYYTGESFGENDKLYDYQTGKLASELAKDNDGNSQTVNDKPADDGAEDDNIQGDSEEIKDDDVLEDEGDGQQEEDDKAEEEPAQEVSDLFQEVYLPYAKREKPFVFEGVKTFAQNTTAYTVEIKEPNSADACSITFTDKNSDYVYIAFAPNEVGAYTIMILSYHQASSGSEVSLSNYSSDGSAAYDKFTTQAAGESSKEVRGTSEQQAFLFPK